VTRLYISGAMSGRPDFGFPQFNAAASHLRRIGWEVVNPAETDGGDTSREYTYYLRKDIEQLLRCDAIVLLPGWEDSRGANIEKQVAEVIGLKVYFYDPTGSESDPYGPLSGQPETILEEAQRLIHGDRQASYGHPSDNLGQTAALWSAYLKRKLAAPITGPDVAWMMVLLKASRDSHHPKADNLTDAAGYVGTIELMRERESNERQAN
jgi:hypothetical protein